MYFYKIAHPANFVFAERANVRGGWLTFPDGRARFASRSIGADVHRIEIDHPRSRTNPSQAMLESEIGGESLHSIVLDPNGALRVVHRATGATLLRGKPGAMFGRSGEAWMFQFEHERDMQFYGLGEHCRRLEKSGQRTKFWNTDMFGDFAHCEVYDGHPNPMYVAIPWVIVKRRNRYVGILVHNPGAVFMDLASNFVWNERNAEDRNRRSFYVGAPNGRPELYIVVGPTLADLTRKLQTLVGRTPLPPLWALGHQQCRWGYAGPRDLWRLDREFRRHEIPCDGLWIDIDYMDQYKVFTLAPRHWGTAAQAKAELANLAAHGRRVVPILDPGVKVQRSYSVCEEGLQQRLFCLNGEGKPYVGFVWPGKTYFPDFSLPEVRAWWAKHVRKLAELGFGGTWIDMNDPSVGVVELDDMRFGRGRAAHDSYHNQYALGMAEATHAGFLAARPDERPFILSRSAYISSARYAAVWLGDNVSNWHHLRLAIPTTLGLALSGQPFCGPDVCGFMRDATPDLAVAWYKTCFLFPFFRNHSGHDTRHQEPWTFGRTATGIVAHYIRLRYKLLPYLYQLFVAQEETGAAILRPLFHDFADSARLPLGRIEDQFLVGPAIMQAPVVQEGQQTRAAVLPGGTRWFAADSGQWLAGGRRMTLRSATADTPLFIHEGAIVPMQVGERTTNANDLSTIEVHCFLRRDTRGRHMLRYVCDDGLTFDYRRGERSEITIAVRSDGKGALAIAVRDAKLGYKPIRVRFVVYDRFARIGFTDTSGSRVLTTEAYAWRFTGRRLQARATEWIDVALAAATARR